MGIWVIFSMDRILRRTNLKMGKERILEVLGNIDHRAFELLNEAKGSLGQFTIQVPDNRRDETNPVEVWVISAFSNDHHSRGGCAKRTQRGNGSFLQDLHQCTDWVKTTRERDKITDGVRRAVPLAAPSFRIGPTLGVGAIEGGTFG